MARIQGLEAEILGHLRHRFPDVPKATRLRFRPLRVNASHEMVVAETVAKPVRRLLIKGPRTYASTHGQRPENEHRVLTTVGPRISAQDPSTRCPEILAYYPDLGLVLLEMVEGVNLRSLLFGPARLLGGTDLPRLLRLCGDWLARFHALTRSGEDGDPLEWLTETLERPTSGRIFSRYADHDTHRRLRDVVIALRRDHPDFRSPRCTIHGEFTPYNVLVHDGHIYVIDFEGSRTGYAYEDLALFTAYGDIAPPWRRLTAAARIDRRRQQRIFEDSYFSRAGPPREPERAVLAVARLLGAAKFLAHLEHPVRGRTLKYRVLGPWWRHGFRLACRRQLAALGISAPRR